MRMLSGLTTLTHLDLGHSNLKDEDLNHLLELTALTSLGLSHCQVRLFPRVAQTSLYLQGALGGVALCKSRGARPPHQQPCCVVCCSADSQTFGERRFPTVSR